MSKTQIELAGLERPPVTPVFDGAGDYERCSKCAEIHWVGWPCYRCKIVRARIRRRGFVNPLAPSPKYLAKTPAKCTHCGLVIWERTRKQTFHPECKDIWDEAKRKVFRRNQIIWWIRQRGYYVRDDIKHGISGMSDEEILVAIGHGIPLDIVRENRPEGGFRFVKVEFRGDYPWRPRPKRSTVLRRIAEHEALKTPSKPLLDKALFVQIKKTSRQKLRNKQRPSSLLPKIAGATIPNYDGQNKEGNFLSEVVARNTGRGGVEDSQAHSEDELDQESLLEGE